MRVSIISLTALIGVVSSAAVAASCSSKTSGGTDDGGMQGSSSSGGSDVDAGDEEAAAIPCVQFTDDAGLTAPVVSFKKDVMPVFEHSCGLSGSCHGDTTDVAQRGIFLGCDVNYPSPSTTTCTLTTDPTQQVYAGLVGSADGGADSGLYVPLEESCMPFVTAGSPTMSYLMHKMDGDQCILTCCTPDNIAVNAAEVQTENLTVSGNGWCGQFMPYNVALLTLGPVCGGTSDCTSAVVATRDTVRAWIAQGALNN
jgi:hypothetical protein